MQKLLLVDSGSDDAVRLKDYLANLGYKISAIVRTPEQAIKNARIFNPDFIVMDFNIRQKSTRYSLYENIRAQNQDIPILYMSVPAA